MEEPDEWVTTLSELRRASNTDGGAAATARARLEVLMMVRGDEPWFEPILKDRNRTHAVLEETIRGRPNLRSVRGLPRLTQTPIGVERLTDPRWRAGLLDHFEWSETEIANPVAYFDRTFRNRLIEARREGRRKHVARFQSLDEPRPDGRVLQLADGPLRSPLDPVELPREVARTYSEAAQFSALVLRLWPTLARELANGTDPAELTLLVKYCVGLHGYLERDIALREQRERWTRKLPARDGWARAWQSDYHRREGNGDYTSAAEFPDRKANLQAARQRDTHLLRFRKTFAAAVLIGQAIVSRRDARVGTAIPIEWAPPRHGSLTGGD